MCWYSVELVFTICKLDSQWIFLYGSGAQPSALWQSQEVIWVGGGEGLRGKRGYMYTLQQIIIWCIAETNITLITIILN